MKLSMNPKEALLASVVGLAVAVLAPPALSWGLAQMSKLRPWMKVSEVKVTVIKGVPHVTAHREVRRLVVGGRYAGEVFDVSASSPHQVCTGTGFATYSPDEPEIIGPMDLDLYLGGRRGQPRHCVPALMAGHEYALTTVWCLPSPSGCDGEVMGPRVQFRMPDDWTPPPAGDLIR